MSAKITTAIQAVPTPLVARISSGEYSGQLAADRKVNDAQSERQAATERVTKAASDRDQANQRLQQAKSEEQRASRAVQAALLEKQQAAQQSSQQVPGELVSVVV